MISEYLIQAAQLLTGLSLLIVLHELGHFLPAKRFGVRVEKFYLFFDIKKSLIKKKIGETEYGIGWLPLGGYVKLSGMIDESMDTEALKEPAKPWEFRAKPAWQRLIIMLGGVTVNLILGMFIYGMTLWIWGENYISIENAKYGVHVSELAQEIGFQDGDQVKSIDGVPVSEDFTYGDFQQEFLLNSEIKQVTVENNGIERIVERPNEFAKSFLKQGKRGGLMSIRTPVVVDSVIAGKGAEAGGVLKGDQIVAVDDTATLFFGDVVRALQHRKDQDIALSVVRNSDTLLLTAHVSETGKLGFGNQGPSSFFEISIKSYTFLEAIPGGVNKAFSILGSYIDQFKLVFTKEGITQIGGFGTLGSLYSSSWDWQSFWSITAFLSLVLAFMNVLPIPALDGGHVMFLLYEVITGKKPPEKFMEVAQMIGIILLLSLLLFANGNDLLRLFK